MHHYPSSPVPQSSGGSRTAGIAFSEFPDPRRLRLACLLVYAGLLLSLSGLFAYPPPAAASAFQITQHWSAKDGLAKDSVQAMSFDSSGYLWLGTVDGLSRFDGVRFRSFRLREYPDLGSNRISALAATPDGSVWIGTDHRGLVRYHRGVFRPLTICDQNCRISKIAATDQGRLWVLSSSGLYRVDSWSGQATLRVELMAPPLARMSLLALPDGGAAYSLNDRLRMHDASGELVAELKPQPGAQILELGLLGEAPVAVTTTGVFVFGPDGEVEVLEGAPRPIEPGADRIATAAFAGGRLVLQTLAGQLLTVGDSSSGDVELGRIDLEPAPQMLVALDGDAGGLWLGTRVEGLFRVSQAQVFNTTGYRDPAIGSVLPIVDHPDSGVLVGGVCGGLFQIDAEGMRRKIIGEGDPLQRCIWTLHSRPNGDLLVGGFRRRIQRLRSGQVESLPMDGSRDGVSRANFLIEAHDGGVWLGARDGLYRIDQGRVVPIDGSPPGISLLSGRVRADGTLLIGSAAGLYEYGDRGFERIETGHGIDELPVRSILRLPDGAWLFGTYGGGLWKRLEDRWYQLGPDQGLVEDVVSCMLTDSLGRLWTSGNRGISTLRISQLREFVEGKRARVHAWALTEEDGLPNAETNGGGQPACHRDRRGRLWFPTVEGPVAFDPESIDRFDPGGALLIESVRLDGSPLAVDRAVRLPADARNLEIVYTSPQFDNAHRLRFRYRLAGIDDRWVQAGNERVARYPVVPGGSYRFEVQLGVDDGRWLNSFASVGFSRPVSGIRIETWVLVLAAMALAGLFGFFRWRIVALRRRDIELNEIIDKRTEKLREMNARLDELSRTDELTGIANHRRFRFYLADQWSAAEREESALSVIVFDVDHFKQFNDALGHPAGDRLLTEMAQTLSRKVKAMGGLLARYGGEEFVAVLPGQELQQAAEAAESLRGVVESLSFRHPGTSDGFVSISLGVAASVPSQGGSAEDLVQRADDAMYAAKRAGRNRVATR